MKKKIRKTGMDKNVFLKGGRIILCPLGKQHINRRYLSWLNDPEVTKFMETGLFPTTDKALEDFYRDIVKSKTGVMFAILTRRNNAHIGNIKLDRISWIHRYGTLGIMIGEKECWGKGYGQEACRLVLEHAFKRLNLNKVTLGVYAIHKSALRAYEAAGFKTEGRVKDILYFDGRYVDKIIMGISKNEFFRLWKQ